ncbi:MAG: serine/threonine protein kinase [Sulfurimonas sp.]|jgi:serine/threonine protein kinase|uniref:lipopolysaccharide kinase InaA family protein n=1 Tax=Sulfurimonas sp. TaxID=2022749 RepID=UPI0039E2DA01
MHKIVINDSYEFFKSFLLNIQSYFNENTQTIHKARNELKVIHYKDIDTIVKSFKVPNVLRRVVYTYFRDSKAKKSYDNSVTLKDFTPTPIAYIEFFQSGLINESYFVSEKFNYDFTIREPLLDDNFENRDAIFKAFAKFTYELHQNNILHLDYSPGNILIEKKSNSFNFKVVDINRMEFRTLTLGERLQNFNKLWAKDSEISIMAKEYASLMNENEDQCIKVAVDYNNKHKNKMRLKKRLKGQKLVD